MGQLTIRQLGFALGAEVTGVDLRQPLEDLAREEILRAWHQHLVLVFPEALKFSPVAPYVRRALARPIDA